MTAARLYNHAAAISLIALLFLCLAWELWWAPLRPGGSWLVLKGLPLLAPLFGILRGKRYTHQWAPLLALAYFVEGLVRIFSEGGPTVCLAGTEVVLAAILFAAAALYVRTTRKDGPRDTADG